MLKFKLISFDPLKDACKISFNRIPQKGWTKNNLEAYLKGKGVQTDFKEQIFDHDAEEKTYLSMFDSIYKFDNEKNSCILQHTKNNCKVSTMPNLPLM